jgi:hypothetical protein
MELVLYLSFPSIDYSPFSILVPPSAIKKGNEYIYSSPLARNFSQLYRKILVRPREDFILEALFLCAFRSKVFGCAVIGSD